MFHHISEVCSYQRPAIPDWELLGVSRWVVPNLANRTALAVAVGLRDQQRCRVDECPCLIDFSRASSLLIVSNDNPTLINFVLRGSGMGCSFTYRPAYDHCRTSFPSEAAQANCSVRQQQSGLCHAAETGGTGPFWMRVLKLYTTSIMMQSCSIATPG